ncbi:hypothetical protein [Methylorubrum thiocyanatum]|uniref:hypothetical protein n=1 Tax=Methylorubrum thiocyanatum TaxID=47958 RepID=UPI003660F746
MPTENFDLTATAWSQVGSAPCVIYTLSSYPALIYVGTSTPALSAPYDVLRSDDDDGFPVTAAGHSVWARALSGTARVSVSPIAAGGAGGGGSANPFPGADYAKTADFGTDGASPPSIAGTGVRGWLRGIFERVEAARALLAGTLTVGGSVTANLGTLGGAATAAAQETGNTSLGTLSTRTGSAADPATPDITAGGASFTLTSLFKGMVAHLLAIRTAITGLLKVDGAVASVAADRSGTITVGGTAQTLMEANAARRGYWVLNLSAGDLWISGLGNAAASQPSLKIPAGALYESPAHHTSSAKLTIFGASTGQAFSAREF